MSSTTTTSAAKKPTVKQPQWYQPENKNNSKPTLKIYNSLTRSKNEFYPNKPGHITWYSCGQPFTIILIWGMLETMFQQISVEEFCKITLATTLNLYKTSLILMTRLL